MKEKNKRQLNPKMDRREMLKKSGLLFAAAPFYFGLNACFGSNKGSLDADVIIVGAGLSGLNAALLLQENGYKTMVVEATNRIGGRVHTSKESDVPGYPELGANEIGGGYARILDIAEKTNVELVPFRPRTELKHEDFVYSIKNELISSEAWANHVFNPFQEEWARKMYPSSPQWAMYSKLNPLPKNNMTAWRDKKYADWDRSIYKVFKEQGWSEEAIKIGVSTNSGYGTDACDLSILMYFQALNFFNQQSSVNVGDGIGRAAKGGNQRIPEAMANAFSGDILLESPVMHIASEKEGVKAHLENGKKLKAKYVLVTLPASALRHITISPKPPIKQRMAISELGYTPSVQIHFVPTKRYWEEDGFPPSMWTDQLSGRFLALKNNPNNPDEVTSCVCYTNGNVALSLDKMPQKETTDKVLKILEGLRPSLKGALRPVYYWTWSKNRFAGGAYAHWKPGQITAFSNEIGLPHERIHFAGEHTAILARGMEGAMESGERSALEIMNLL